MSDRSALRDPHHVVELPELWRPLVATARVVIPSTLLASLFYYFGLRYTDYHYAQYGLDDAALGYTTTDYVVRSLNVTIQPARVVAVTVALAVFAHLAIAVSLRLLAARHPTASAAAGRTLGVLFVAVGATGSVRYWSHWSEGLDPAAQSRWWLVSLVTLAYGLYIGLVRPGPGPAVSRLAAQAMSPREQRTIGTILLTVLLTLITYGAFTFARAYAQDRALQQAYETEAKPWVYPLVRVYSRFDLALDDALGITESRPTSSTSGYRYRYDGMRLFIQDNGRLLLWPADRSPRAGMFILHETADIRVEYQPEPR